jgi:hypothetical protein
MRGQNHKTSAEKRVRHPGIGAAASALGVSRQHLYYVLVGKRTADSLLRRYGALKSEQKKGRRNLICD